LISFERYILTPEIFDKPRHQQSGCGGELQLVNYMSFDLDVKKGFPEI